MTGVRSPTEAEDFSSSPCVQTGSGAHPASCPMSNGGPFPGGKARPGRDADHSPPSSAEVKYEQELYLLSPHAPPWRVAGQLCFFFFALLPLLFVLLFFLFVFYISGGIFLKQKLTLRIANVQRALHVRTVADSNWSMIWWDQTLS
jgi:hypothetical protein